jgi:hypothetical protein
VQFRYRMLLKKKINFSLNVLLWPFSFGHSLIMLAIPRHFMKFLLTDKSTFFRYSLNIDVENLRMEKLRGKKLKCHSYVWSSKRLNYQTKFQSRLMNESLVRGQRAGFLCIYVIKYLQ